MKKPPSCRLVAILLSSCIVVNSAEASGSRRMPDPQRFAVSRFQEEAVNPPEVFEQHVLSIAVLEEPEIEALRTKVQKIAGSRDAKDLSSQDVRHLLRIKTIAHEVKRLHFFKTPRWVLLEALRYLPPNLPTLVEIKTGVDLKRLLDEKALINIPWESLIICNRPFVKNILLELAAHTAGWPANRKNRVGLPQLRNMLEEAYQELLPSLNRNLDPLYKLFKRSNRGLLTTPDYILREFWPELFPATRPLRQAYSLKSLRVLSEAGMLENGKILTLWTNLPDSARRALLHELAVALKKTPVPDVDKLRKPAFLEVPVPTLGRPLSGMYQHYERKCSADETTLNFLIKEVKFVHTRRDLAKNLTALAQGFDFQSADARYGYLRKSVSKSLIEANNSNAMRDILDAALLEVDAALDKDKTSLVLASWREGLLAYWALLDTAEWTPNALEDFGSELIAQTDHQVAEASVLLAKITRVTMSHQKRRQIIQDLAEYPTLHQTQLQARKLLERTRLEGEPRNEALVQSLLYLLGISLRQVYNLGARSRLPVSNDSLDEKAAREINAISISIDAAKEDVRQILSKIREGRQEVISGVQELLRLLHISEAEILQLTAGLPREKRWQSGFGDQEIGQTRKDTGRIGWKNPVRALALYDDTFALAIDGDKKSPAVPTKRGKRIRQIVRRSRRENPAPEQLEEGGLTGSRWPWAEPFYQWVARASSWATRFLGPSRSERFGRFMGQMVAPVLVESGAGMFVFLIAWVSIFGISITPFLTGFVGLGVWQLLHMPGAPGKTRWRKFIVSFSGERGIIALVTWLLTPAVMAIFHIHNPVYVMTGTFGAVHFLGLRFWPRILSVWGRISIWWHYWGTPSAEDFQQAIDWTKRFEIKKYGIDGEQEFLLPAPTFLRANHESVSEASDFALDLLTDFSRIPFTGVLIWAGQTLFRIGRWVVIHNRAHLKESDRRRARMQAHERGLDVTLSLRERRRMFRREFLKHGYLPADHIIQEFQAIPYVAETASSGQKNPETTASTREHVGKREELLHRLEGFFQSVMKWKKGTIAEEQDEKIYKFLLLCLQDPDPWVVKAAVRAIGAVHTHLSEGQKNTILKMYWRMLAHHESEVVRATIARDLSQEMVVYQNLGVAAGALATGLQKPWVECYLAETLEYLIKEYQEDLKRDPKLTKRIADVLLRKAEGATTTTGTSASKPLIGTRVNALRALARLPTIDAQVLETDILHRLGQILENDPDPTVQAAALWCYIRLSILASSHRQIVSFHQSYKFLMGTHKGRRNPILETFGMIVLRQWADRLEDPALQALARRIVPVAVTKPAIPSPVIFLDADPLVGEDSPDTALCLAAEAVSSLLDQLHDANMSVVITHGFRKDRDAARLRGDNHPEVDLNAGPLARVLDILQTDFPALIPSRDPIRGKHANRIDRVVVPVPGGFPIIIIGRNHQASLIQEAWGKPMEFISLALFPELKLPVPQYDRLIRRILFPHSDIWNDDDQSIPLHELWRRRAS
jgi:hypothetical protein